MKALVLSGGAGTRSRPSTCTSADPPPPVADKSVLRAVGPSWRDELTIIRAHGLAGGASRISRALRTQIPRALPHLNDVDVRVGARRTVGAGHGKVRIGS